MKLSDFNKVEDYLWEIPQSYNSAMKVPARIYASEEMLKDILKDRSTDQLIDGASLEGVVKYALAMPDVHEGYSVPIGFVGALEVETGVVAPGLAGFDINCGMRLLKSELSEYETKPHLERLADKIQKSVPSGLGKGGSLKLSHKEINEILERGSHALLDKGFGEEADVRNSESEGKMAFADKEAVSDKAKDRGRDQVGTLGSGNHFLEIQKVSRIFDKKTAEAFGLFESQVVIMIHSGSRGLGHQVCSDYLNLMNKTAVKHNIKIPHKEFACVPFKSSDGQKYFSAMAAAANYAWANRYMMTHNIRRVWSQVLGKKQQLGTFYDVAHNIIKKEKHKVSGLEKELLVHRKGSTRAFPPGHFEVPELYRAVGQPILLPGSMGTSSYILAGTEKGRESFYSVSHGAGRAMSRNAARKSVSGKEVARALQNKGIMVKCHSLKGLAEEAASAYKNIDRVVDIIDRAGLGKKVVELKPLAVVKGE